MCNLFNIVFRSKIFKFDSPITAAAGSVIKGALRRSAAIKIGHILNKFRNYSLKQFFTAD